MNQHDALTYVTIKIPQNSPSLTIEFITAEGVTVHHKFDRTTTFEQFWELCHLPSDNSIQPWSDNRILSSADAFNDWKDSLLASGNTELTFPITLRRWASDVEEEDASVVPYVK